MKRDTVNVTELIHKNGEPLAEYIDSRLCTLRLTWSTSKCWLLLRFSCVWSTIISQSTNPYLFVLLRYYTIGWLITRLFAMTYLLVISRVDSRNWLPRSVIFLNGKEHGHLIRSLICVVKLIKTVLYRFFCSDCTIQLFDMPPLSNNNNEEKKKKI